MASLDALLPATLPSSDSRPAAPASTVPAASVGPAAKPFLILLAKPITPEEKAIFAEFGRCVTWSAKLMNVPFATLDAFDYMFCPMDLKEMRLMLGRTDLAAYNVVTYCSFLQKAEDFVEQLQCVTLTSIPKHAVNTDDFNTMLLNEKLVSPSQVRSAIKWVFKCLKN